MSPDTGPLSASVSCKLPQSSLNRLLRGELRSWKSRYAVAMLVTAVAVVVRSWLAPVLGDELPLATIYGAVGFSVLVGGLGPAILSTGVGFLAAYYLFIAPVQLALISPRDVFYFIACAIIMGTGARLRTIEARLRVNNDRITEQLAELNAIYDGSPLAIAVLDTDLRFRRLNRRLADVNGLSVEQHIGRTLPELVPSAAEQADAARREVLDTGRPVRIEVTGEIRARPGVRSTWDEYWFPLRVGDRLTGIAVIIDDITERRRQEQEIRDSEVMFRELAENVPQLAWMARADGSAFWFNRRWFDYTGTNLAEMIQAGWRLVVHPDHAERVILGHRRAAGRGIAWEDTFPVRDHDGRFRWFLTRAFPLRDNAGVIKRWFGTCTDISVLRETQDALRDAQRQIRQYAEALEKTVAERTAKLRETVQELEAFSYSIAHDMRAPLRAMIGYSDIVREEHASGVDPVGSEYLGRIAASARRLDTLIQDVLNYSRIVREELPVETVDVKRLLLEVLDSYPNLAAARAHIRVDPGLPVVIGNRAALTQVFSNLLQNAVKFVPQNVTPAVRIFAEGAAAPAESNAHTWVKLLVEDNGIGIDPSARPRLFQMFQRFTRPGLYEGTGMGLAISRKAVERMGGTIGVDSAPGKGSRFWICLPAAKGTARPETGDQRLETDEACG